MPRYRVQLVTSYADEVEVAAETPEEAARLARQMDVPTGLTVSDCEIVGIEPIRMDYDEAARHDAGLLT